MSNRITPSVCPKLATYSDSAASSGRRRTKSRGRPGTWPGRRRQSLSSWTRRSGAYATRCRCSCSCHGGRRRDTDPGAPTYAGPGGVGRRMARSACSPAIMAAAVRAAE